MVSDWFKIEKIDDGTFAISEYRHWEETHCYLLLGTKKALFIDTGLGVGNIKQAVDSLTTLPLVATTTHVHWDHIGGLKYFTNISVHENEESWLTHFPMPPEVVKQNLLAKNSVLPKDFDIENYVLFQAKPQIILHDQDMIDLGDRQIRVIHTPGHSPGHCCFYEADRRYLFSGDLIYKGCLDIFYPTTNVEDFHHSIKKVGKLDITRLFPGHHSLEISLNIIGQINCALESLLDAKRAERAKGVFNFGEFQIHI